MLRVMSEPKRKLILIVVIAFVSRLIYVSLTVDPEYDGYSRFLKGIFLLSNPHDLRINWVWLPLFQYLDAGFYWLSRSYMTVRIFSSICGTLTILLLYKLTFAVSKSREAALAASFIMAINPLSLFYDTSGMTQPFFTLLFLTAIYLFILDRIFPVSIMLSILCLTRYEAWFLVFVFYGLAAIYRREKIFTIVASSLVPLAAMGSWLYVNYALYGSFFYFMSPQSAPLPASPETHLLSQVVALLSPIWYMILYFIFLTPPVFVQALKGFVEYSRQERCNLKITLLAFSYVSFHTFFAIARSLGSPSYALPMIPLFTMYAACRVSDKRKSVHLKKFIGFSLTLSILTLSAMTIWYANSISPTIRTSLWLRENAKEGRILCIHEPIAILSGIPTHRFSLLWETNITYQALLQFLTSHNIKYIVSNYGTWSHTLQNFTVSFVSERELFIVYTV